MSDQALFLATEDIETIVAAQEIIYMRRVVELMRGWIDECPTPPPPPPRGVLALPISLVQDDLDKVHKLETLRANIVGRVHVDPEGAKIVARICRENAEAAEGIAKNVKQELP